MAAKPKRAETETVSLEPKAWNVDPRWAATVGAMITASKEMATFGHLQLLTLAQMGQTFVPATIFSIITNQVADFSEPSDDDLRPGWGFRMRGGATPSRNDRSAMRDLADFVHECGRDYWDNGFEGFLRAIVPQSMNFDRYTFEVIRDGNMPYAMVPLDCTTIAKAIPTLEEGMKGRFYPGPDDIAYYQVIDREIRATYKKNQLGWGTRNPSTRINGFAYGTPELELCVPLITDILNIYATNSAKSTAGLRPEALILWKGDADVERFRAIERQILSAMTNTKGRARSPVIQVDPHAKEDVVVVPLHEAMTKLESGEMQSLITKYIFAMYNMDPSEANQIFGAEGQTSTVQGPGGITERSIASRQRRKPILKNIARTINTTAIWPTHSKYEFFFTGLDPRSEKERQELEAQTVGLYMSPDELRVSKNLDPYGDVVSSRPLHQSYAAWVQQQMQEQAQGTAAGGAEAVDDTLGFDGWLEGKRMALGRK